LASRCKKRSSQQCDQECEAYLQKFKKEIAITDQEWQEYTKDMQQFKQQSVLSKPYKNAKRKDSQDPIRTLMMNCNINPDAVDIDKSNKTGSWSEQRFDGKYNHILHLCKDETFSFALGPVMHELIHFKNYDCIQANLLNELLCKRGLTMETIQSHNCSGLRKGIEIRADIMTACQSIELGKNLKECLHQFAAKRNVPLDKEREFSYHPSLAKRFQAIDATIAYKEALF